MQDFVVLKEDQMYLVSDKEGNIDNNCDSKYGIYYKDTRIVKNYKVYFLEFETQLLDTNFNKNYYHEMYLTNNTYTIGDIKVPRQTIDIKKERILNEAFIEKITITNYNNFPVKFTLVFDVKVDFTDIFEIRGDLKKLERKIVCHKNDNGCEFIYSGLDNIKRRVKIILDDLSFVEKEGLFQYTIFLNAKESKSIQIKICPDNICLSSFEKCVKNIEEKYEQWYEENTSIITDNKIINKILEQSVNDLRILITEIEGHKFYAAGIPWFTTLFGRDSIIASFFSIIINPHIAKSTLKLLSYYQGRKIDLQREEQPGKILHELRLSELPNIGAVPFGKYYGSIDSTLLYLILVVEYFDWTGNIEFIREIKGSILNALNWIDEYGDLDKDGYVEYIRSTESGLINQGWKDSTNCIVYQDGRLAEAPIALCEVQGYVYYVKKQLSRIFKILGDYILSQKLNIQARELKERFNKDFWMEDSKFFAFALDKDKNKVDSITSNVGHCLFTGIIDEDKINFVVEKIMSKEMYSGWGIRTLSSCNAAYNPISYHNGSIWPHDTSLVAYGMRKVKKYEECIRISKGIFDAANYFNGRLPELFCGFSKKEREIPILYPVACKPQAWATASPIFLIRCILGIIPDAYNKKIYIEPLPNNAIEINEVIIKNLRVGDSLLDLKVDKENVEITKIQGEIKILRNYYERG